MASAALLLAVAACGDGASASGSDAGGSSQAAVGGASAGSGGRAGGGSAQGGAAAGGEGPGPAKPSSLTSYLVGNDADAIAPPTGPATILMGGGNDVDEAFLKWRDYLSEGDVVVLRSSGSDGYNDYLYQQIGGCDSVETLLVTSSALANDDYVNWRLRHAEGIFIAGGDQANYLTYWKGSALQDSLQHAHQRGAALGGTSAGCAVLGGFIFAAYNDTVYSSEALSDPYNPYMQLERDFLALSPLSGIITDTHFAQRDRFGRLVGFVARLLQDDWTQSASGIGLDEGTALFVDPSGMGTVMGAGRVYWLNDNGKPQQCQPGQPLQYANLNYHVLAAGDQLSLPNGATAAPSATVSAAAGQLTPADPY